MKVQRLILLSFFCLISLCCLHAQRLSLDSCISLATSNNLELRNANLEIERAQQVRYQALTKFFPNISAQAFAFHSLHPLLEIGAQDIINGVSDQEVRAEIDHLYHEYGQDYNLEQMFGFFQYGVTAGATAIQPVFMGGQVINGNRLAKIGIEAAKLQASITERDLQMQIEQTFLMIVGLEEKRTTLKAVEALLDTLTNNLTSAIEAGLTTNNDMLRIDLKRNEIQGQELQLENGLILAKQALCSYIGLLYSDSIEVDTIGIYQFDSQQVVRPEKALLELNIKAENLRKKIEIGKALPQVAVGGTYAYNRLFKDNNQHNGLLFATIQIPLTAWWETGHKIKEMSLATEQVQNKKEYLNQQMELQSLQAQQAVILAEKQMIIAQQALTNADENMRIALINYQAGLTTLSDLLEAQTLQLQAQNTLTDTHLQVRLAQRKAREY